MLGLGALIELALLVVAWWGAGFIIDQFLREEVLLEFEQEKVME